jgi:cell division cycle 20-like protein 1 (cofactor of APC complex)
MVGDFAMRETTIESGYSSVIIPGTIDDSRSPALVSPPDIKTPPLVTGKRNHLNGNLALGKERAGSEPIDPNVLSKALKDFEEAGNIRDRTPGGSPSRKRQRIYGDRLVDVRGYSANSTATVMFERYGNITFARSIEHRANNALH